MTDTTTKDCTTCRYVGTYKRPRIMDSTGIDDQLMFDDVDETVYMCKAFHVLATLGKAGPTRDISERDDDGNHTGDGMRFEVTFETNVVGSRALCSHAGTERLVPITCDAWSAVPPKDTERLAELDRMIAARDARNAARTSADARDDGKIEAKK